MIAVPTIRPVGCAVVSRVGCPVPEGLLDFLEDVLQLLQLGPQLVDPHADIGEPQVGKGLYGSLIGLRPPGQGLLGATARTRIPSVGRRREAHPGVPDRRVSGSGRWFTTT